MIIVSAFGVEHTVTKSFIPGGGDNDYKESHLSASKTTREQRLQIAGRVGESRRKRRLRIPSEAQGPRDLHEVYGQHGYFNRQSDDWAQKPRDPVEEMKEPSSPSTVHRNVHYGQSVLPKYRKKIDDALDPKLVATLKHPVVYHHDPHTENMHGAALGAHVTTGGKAHVVLSGTRFHDDKDTAETINHELAHAQLKTTPYIAPRRLPRAVGGEEGRADAVSGTDRYLKNGMQPPDHPLTHGALRIMRAKPVAAGLKAWTGSDNTNMLVQNAHGYHTARSAVIAARKLKP